jgi:hypothetical protein
LPNKTFYAQIDSFDALLRKKYFLILKNLQIGRDFNRKAPPLQANFAVYIMHTNVGKGYRTLM